MLRIRRIEHLAAYLGATPERVKEVADTAGKYYQRLMMMDPAKPDKPREVVSVNGEMRKFQSRLYRHLLLPLLPIPASSHGSVPGRSIKTNAIPHAASAFVYKADISGFYPSVHYKRVYKLFVDDFECTPDVARLCTRICTYRHHLALGLITSPILANRILAPIDARISAICRQAGLVYTRYVDDITISGPFDLKRLSGIPKTISTVLAQHGFRVNEDKNEFGGISDQSITGLRLVRGHFDATRDYIIELERQLEDALRLSYGEAFTGPYYTADQIWGRLQFVLWVNPGRKRQLIPKFREISWKKVRREASRLGLVAVKKTLTPLD